MFPDFIELLSVFNAHRVKYLIVGGYAVSFHSQPRATKDLDILVKADAVNAEAVYSALAEFGAPLESISVRDLADPTRFFRFGHPPIAVDILSAVDGVEFDSAWNQRIEAVVDPDSGLRAFFISRGDLIASKIAAGRLRDLADVEEIREAHPDEPSKTCDKSERTPEG
ncbi:MAG TPA: DUF6036 family nucleotidyltransferase [Terracidiphilus sp.]|nr:DUF6036 family nucleotidyltransferase [Terracidiphilus sp.]